METGTMKHDEGNASTGTCKMKDLAKRVKRRNMG